MRNQLFCLGFALFSMSVTASDADSVLEKSKRDEIARVRSDDGDIEAAFRKARATLKEFLALVHEPRPSIASYAVKIEIPDRDKREFFWISHFTQENGRLVGRIANTPRLVRNVPEGERISFKESDVVDWVYRENGKMVGNYTACALIKKEPPPQAEAFKKEYGLSCDP